MDEPTAPPAGAKTPKTAVVTLGEPVRRGETSVSSVTLRKPVGGDLRGCNLQDLLQSDVNALIKVVPRISEPALTEQEVAALEADDFAEIGGTIFGFFMTAAQRAAIARLMG